MNGPATDPDVLTPSERIVMIIGAYGSGKTEVAVNLALTLARAGRKVQLADLDLVNPYFRSRERRALLEEQGVRVVVPPGEQAQADLPIVLPEIRGMLQPPDGTVTIFDVGGDDVGARVISSLRPSIPDGYALWQVLNARRPFTDTVAGCLKMRDALEGATRLRVTGFVANTHLIEETTPDAVLEGWRVAQAASEQAGIPVRLLAVMASLADDPLFAAVSTPRLRLERRMLPPWKTADGPGNRSSAGERGLGAGPIGRPPSLDTIRRHGGNGADGPHRD